MANGRRTVSTMRLLKQAMDVIFRYHSDHMTRVSGRQCQCHVCQDASFLFDEVLAHTRRQVFANPRLLIEKAGADKEENKE